MRPLILTFVLLLCAACGRVPEVDEAQAAEVVREARELMSSSKVEESIPAERWPAAIKKLEPTWVFVKQDGVYIATSSFYVQQWGLFVPRQPDSFVPTTNTDPSYKPIYPPLFSYYVAG